jgi:hypothetical protein
MQKLKYQNHLRMMSGSCQDHVRIMSGWCQDHVRMVSGSCQDGVRIMPGSCQDHARIMSGWCQDHVRIMSGSCQDGVRIMPGSCQDEVRMVSRSYQDHVKRCEKHLYWKVQHTVYIFPYVSCICSAHFSSIEFSHKLIHALFELIIGGHVIHNAPVAVAVVPTHRHLLHSMNCTIYTEMRRQEVLCHLNTHNSYTQRHNTHNTPIYFSHKKTKPAKETNRVPESVPVPGMI